MRKQYIYFTDIPVGCEFSLNGNRWLKKSTRTACIIKPVEYTGTWFYFSKKDLCILTNANGGA